LFVIQAFLSLDFRNTPVLFISGIHEASRKEFVAVSMLGIVIVFLSVDIADVDSVIACLLHKLLKAGDVVPTRQKCCRLFPIM
jgi:hypothetical protein